MIIDDGETFYEYDWEDEGGDAYMYSLGDDMPWLERSDDGTTLRFETEDKLLMDQPDRWTLQNAVLADEEPFGTTPVNVTIYNAAKLLDESGNEIDVAVNGEAAYIAVYAQDGSLKSVSAENVSLSDNTAGTVSVNTGNDWSNVIFTPAEDYRGDVTVKVAIDGIEYQVNILVVPEASCLVLNHESLGWHYDGDPVYAGSGYGLYVLKDQISYPATWTVDYNSPVVDKGTIEDDVADTDENGNNTYVWDNSNFMFNDRWIHVGTNATWVKITWTEGGTELSAKFDAKALPTVQVTGPDTLSVNGGEYVFTVSGLDPRETSCKTSFIRMWVDYEYNLDFWSESVEFHGDGTATVTYDMSRWEDQMSSLRGQGELEFGWFEGYAYKNVTITD